MLCNSTILKQDKTKFIYGAEWAGTENPAWVRTDNAIGFEDPQPAINGGTGSSPFDDIMPWSGMVRENIPDLGEFVAIPKFYYKWTKTDSKLKLQISMYKYPNFHTSPAHMDRGDGKGERDVIYVGRYYYVDINTSSSGSFSGETPYTSTYENMLSALSNRSDTSWMMDYATLVTIQMLYLVEFANWNSQAMIGYGCGSKSSSTSRTETGSTDAMQYHTGTMQATRETPGVGIQYRYIEDLWANRLCYISGWYNESNNNKGVYITLNPSEFVSGGINTVTGQKITDYNVMSTSPNKITKSIGLSEVSNFNWVWYINETIVETNDNIYICDSSDIHITVYNEYLAFGGKSNYGDTDCRRYGLFYFEGNKGNMYSDYVSRLMILP